MFNCSTRFLADTPLARGHLKVERTHDSMTVHFAFIYFYLHDGVVRRDVVGEQVKVPGGKDKGKQHLRFPRNACRGREKGRQMQSQHTNYETSKICH